MSILILKIIVFGSVYNKDIRTHNIPDYLDTGIFDNCRPMCILKCDSRYMFQTDLNNFPLNIQLNSDTFTKHCRSRSVNQIVCPQKYKYKCPFQLNCNLKMNGSRDPKIWSWECRDPNRVLIPKWGKLYFESCYGNKDMSCINVASYHFRPIDLKTSASIKYNDSEEPLKNFYTIIAEAIVYIIMILIIIANVLLLELLFLKFADSSNEFIIGGLFGLMLSGAFCASESSDYNLDYNFDYDFDVTHEVDD